MPLLFRPRRPLMLGGGGFEAAKQRVLAGG
jgi:hypothetical protein